MYRSLFYGSFSGEILYPLTLLHECIALFIQFHFVVGHYIFFLLFPLLRGLFCLILPGLFDVS